MASLLPSPVFPTADRRLAGLLATILVHAALILTWQMARTPSPARQADEETMQWLRLPPPVADTRREPAAGSGALPPPGPARPAAARAAPARPAAVPAAPVEPAAPAAQAAQAAETDAAMQAPAQPNAAAILENARRSAAGIDRALRKENKALIIAPPDSAALRMRRSMEQARALAPPRLWEAPKVEELVNNTGDGARRTRVITGRGTYCITERSPATNVEMIEMHGKIRLTSCPTPEEPAKRQEWRTARD